MNSYKDWINPRFKKIKNFILPTIATLCISTGTYNYITKPKPSFKIPDVSMSAPDWQNRKSINNNYNADKKRNFALRENLESFHSISTRSSHPTVKSDTKIDELTPQQKAASDLFKKILLRAFNDDHISNQLPFNIRHIEDMANEVVFYFAQFDQTLKFTGQYRPQNDTILINSNLDNNQFVLTALHEFGHKLGLGEALAELFADECIGHTQSDYKNWLYNNEFERKLLHQDGMNALTFWRAAFTSNKAFSELWNSHINIISHEELTTLRALYAELHNGNHTENYLKHFKRDWKSEFEYFAQVFNYCSTKENPQEIKQKYTEEMREFIQTHIQFTETIGKEKFNFSLAQPVIEERLYPNEYKAAKEKFFTEVDPPFHKTPSNQILAGIFALGVAQMIKERRQAKKTETTKSPLKNNKELSE